MATLTFYAELVIGVGANLEGLHGVHSLRAIRALRRHPSSLEVVVNVKRVLPCETNWPIYDGS